MSFQNIFKLNQLSISIVVDSSGRSSEFIPITMNIWN